MKQWKVVLVTAVIALLVVALCLSNWNVLETGEQTIRDRIGQYKLIAEEQRFITEIWTLRYEAAVMQAKFNPVADANAPPR